MKYTSNQIKQIIGGFVLLMLFSLVSMPSLSAQDDEWPEFEDEKNDRRTTYR